MSKYPDRCTLCGTPFEDTEKNHDGRIMRFPYPPNHYLCYSCFTKSLDKDLNRLNRVLAGETKLLSIHQPNELKDET